MVLMYQILGESYLLTDQYDRATADFQKGLRLQPDNILGLLWLAATYSMAGREKKAHETASKLLRLNPKFSLEHVEKMAHYEDRAVKKRFVDALRKAGLKSRG